METSLEDRKYRVIANELRDNILAGRYAPGAAFPSVKMLCRRFNISHLTAAKVIETLKDMGLVHTRNGVGTFVARRMRSIGLIVPMQRQVEIFPPIVREISRLAQEKAIGIEYADISEFSSSKVKALTVETARRMSEIDLSGVIFHPVDFGADRALVNREVERLFSGAGVPLVMLDSSVFSEEGTSPYDFVGVDNREIGEMVGSHVIERGAKSVAFVAWSDISGNVKRRLDGLLFVIASKRGSRFAGRYIWQRDASEMARKWKNHLPNAIVCSSDLVAAHVLKLLLKIKKRCPQDVLVTGVNDVDLATLVSPPLTTVHQPCEAIANAAFETLLWRMENPTAATRRILVATDLVIRESTTR